MNQKKKIFLEKKLKRSEKNKNLMNQDINFPEQK